MRTFVVAVALIASVYACASRADATTEFCPASVAGMKASGADSSAPASSYQYVLAARTSRTIGSASIVADTDRGWYAWNVGGIDLDLAFRHSGSHSAWMFVTFPEPVTIRHAWITSAKATSATGFGWETLGTFDCEVPSYADRGVAAAPVAREQSRRPGSSPAPAAPSEPLAAGELEPAGPAERPPDRASPAQPPFASLDCAVPFRLATVTMAASPDFPNSLRESFEPGMQANARVAVSLDERGHLVDLAIFQSSGLPIADRESVRAARLSTYAPAISYCQYVRGAYLFNTTFESER